MASSRVRTSLSISTASPPDARAKKFSPDRDRQQESTRLSQVALPLAEPVDFSVIQRLPDFWSAIELCIRAAGKDPKAAYVELGIDKGQWSRIANGQAHFPHNKLLGLMDEMGNDIPLQWLAYRRGKGLHLLESEQQRLLRAKDEEIADLRKQVEWTTRLVQGRTGDTR